MTSIDGIGLILALTIMLETGDISRFNKVGHYASYCRCVSGARYSNGKKKSKTNTKNGNKYLAWAFIEAANFAYMDVGKEREHDSKDGGGRATQEAKAEERKLCHSLSGQVLSPVPV